VSTDCIRTALRACARKGSARGPAAAPLERPPSFGVLGALGGLDHRRRFEPIDDKRRATVPWPLSGGARIGYFAAERVTMRPDPKL